MRANLSALSRRLRRSWQGLVGVLCVVAAVALLATPAWALLALGGFLLVGAFSDSVDRAVAPEQPGGY